MIKNTGRHYKEYTKCTSSLGFFQTIVGQKPSEDHHHHHHNHIYCLYLTPDYFLLR
jgi:hypothetical protein